MQATQTRTDQPCTILDAALSRKRSRARQEKKKKKQQKYKKWHQIRLVFCIC